MSFKPDPANDPNDAYEKITISRNCHTPIKRRCPCRRTNEMQPERQSGADS